MKKILIFIVCIILICAPTGCSSKTQQQDTPTQAPEATPEPMPSLPAIALVLDGENAFNAELVKEFETAVSAGGYRALTYYSDTADAQVEHIYSALGEAAKAIVVLPVDMDNMQVPMEECETQGVPVVNIMVPINGVLDMLISPDYQEIGALAAQRISTRLAEGQSASVLLLESNAAFVSQLIHDGFLKQATTLDNISVTAAKITENTEQSAQETVAAALTEYPHITTVFAENEESALGAVAAAEQSGKTIDVITVGGSKTLMEAVLNGKINASIFVSPFQLAQQAAYFALLLANDAGTEVPQYIGLDVETILPTDASDYLARGSYAHLIAPYVVGPQPTQTPPPAEESAAAEETTEET